MTAISTPYAHTQRLCSDGTFLWETDTFNLALVASTYTFSAAHTLWSDVSTHEIATGNGYTTGGIALTNNTLSDDGFFTDDLVWSALTATFRSGVIYRVGTINTLVNPIFCYILWNASNVNKVIPGIDFGVFWSADGVVKFS